MNEVPEEQRNSVRKYLLGTLDEEMEMRRIEEQILLDDDFAEQLAIAEDELIEQYLDGSLTAPERRQFADFFLSVPENREKLRLVEHLKKYAARDTGVPARAAADEKNGAVGWRKLFSFPALRLAAIVIAVAGLGFGIWRIGFYQSDVDRGLAQMRLAYGGQRPLEPRTSADLDYAPPASATRGAANQIADEKAHSRAERFLLDAAADETNAAARQSLGLLYLNDRKYDQAFAELNAAANLSPADASVHSDLGAAYFEKAKLAETDGKNDVFLENVNAALRELDRALELNPNLLAALFNRALVLQKMPAVGNQALGAWAKYLEKDSSSPWADEARRQIQKLESQKSISLSADQVEKAFLNAFRARNETAAASLIADNRELIKGKYLPQKLAMSWLDAAEGEEKSEYLRALAYAGELEKKTAGDASAADLADFYRRAAPAVLEKLKQAQAEVRLSYESCLAGKLADASERATRARDLFAAAGDVYEARLSEFIIIYCLIKNGGTKTSVPLAAEMAEFCRSKKYKWLLANLFYWLAGAQRSLGDRQSSAANYQNCLRMAQETGDKQVLQKIFVTLANQNKFVGRHRAALDYLHRAIEISPGTALRERWRTYSDGIQILSAFRLYSLAKAFSLENIRLAAESGDASFVSNSQLDAGILYAQLDDYDDARQQLTAAEQSGAINLEGADRTEIMAKSLLTQSYLERKRSNFAQAAEYNERALNIVSRNEVPFFLYEIQKSRLLTSINLRDEAKIDEQLAQTIELAETYRRQIAEEQSRSSFFNDQQDIYDIAVARELSRNDYARAYSYLETSNARSLLDWLKKGVSVNYEKEKIKTIETAFDQNSEPAGLNEMRAQMPARVQILQYAVLEDKVVIWLISRDQVSVAAAPIAAETLRVKIESYVEAIADRDVRRQEEARRAGRELYDLLIAPIADRLDQRLEICLIPQKILFHLPFAALTAPNEQPFLTQFEFFYAPSANVFLLCTKNALEKTNAAQPETLLSVGNPRFDRAGFGDLENLPDAETEARNITAFYPVSETLIGSAATKTAMQNALAHASIVNFAGHYLVKHGEPLASGLLLTPDAADAASGILTNAELVNKRMPQAKLVVLSACQTGIEQYYNGEGLVGLSRTFLAAGVPLVVASQWRVDSAATAELIQKFHFYRKRENLSTAAALRRAQLEMIESPDGTYRQPFFWAAFAAYGGYAEF